MKIPKLYSVSKNNYKRVVVLKHRSNWILLCENHTTNGRKWVDSIWFDVDKEFLKNCIWVKWGRNIVSWKQV